MNIFNLFDRIPAPKLKRNAFNLSHDVKLTTEFGLLTPMMSLNCVPGDTFSFSTETFCRMAPIISPVMDGINIFNYYFKVPLRLLMDEEDYNDFFVQGNSASFPKISFTKAEANLYLKPGTLLDYLGYPTLHLGDDGQLISATFDGVIEFSALPLLAYGLVYNEYFRDERLIEEIDLTPWVGNKTATECYNDGLLSMRRKAYKKDYFTSALPFTQDGPQAKIPMVGDVNIEFLNNYNPTRVKDADGGNLYSGEQLFVGSSISGSNANRLSAGPDLPQKNVQIDNSRNLKGTFNNVEATIADLRYMTSMQRYLEAKARGGSRTAEWLLSIYGVRPSDLRLHRPEFIGSVKVPLVVQAVDQTSATTDVSPLAYQAGKGAGFAKGQASKVFCDEHSLILGLTVVVPQNTYFQGCSKHLTKFDPYDYFIPQFQGLGEQAIKRGELYYSFGAAAQTANNATFGYQSQYCEYKFEPNRVHGDFKQSLSFYHLGRYFGSAPALNQSFIEINPSVGDLNRIFATELYDQDGRFEHFWVEFYHHVTAKRPLKLFGMPSKI